MQRHHGRTLTLGFGPDTLPNYAALIFGLCIIRATDEGCYMPVHVERGNDAGFTVGYTGISGL